MNEPLLAELNRLLDAGEPLLKMLPPHETDDCPLQPPDNISDEMYCYTIEVALRAQNRKGYQNHRQQDPTNYLAELVEILEAGLLGWRTIGMLK